MRIVITRRLVLPLLAVAGTALFIVLMSASPFTRGSVLTLCGFLGCVCAALLHRSLLPRGSGWGTSAGPSLIASLGLLGMGLDTLLSLRGLDRAALVASWTGSACLLVSVLLIWREQRTRATTAAKT